MHMLHLHFFKSSMDQMIVCSKLAQLCYSLVADPADTLWIQT